MGQAYVVRRFDAPASTLWGIISWRGMAQLVGDGLFSGCRFESETDTVGATKWLHLGEGVAIRERLEWLDDDMMGYGYRIIDSGTLPITDYVGSVRVGANGPDACTVLIRCQFVGTALATDADWERDWAANESAMLDRVAHRLAEGTLPNATAAASDITAIVRARSTVFEADFAAGDAARLVDNYYVAVPRVIMPDTPLLEGRAAIEAMFAGMMRDFSACHLKQIEVRQSGDMAYELSEATVMPRDPAADPLAVRYIIIWNQVAGVWRVAIDFFAWGHLGLESADAS